MSVKRNGNDGLGYNDIHFQVIDEQRTYTSANASSADKFTVEPLQDGGTSSLDHNELAELVYMRRHLYAGLIIDDSTTATSVGSAELSLSLEVNSGQGEWVVSDTRDARESRIKNDNVDFVEVRVDEGYKDSTNGVGAGAGNTHWTKEREVWPTGDDTPLDTGMVVDPNDQLDIRTEGNLYQCDHNAFLKGTYVLGWDIHQLEDARREFGLPDD